MSRPCCWLVSALVLLLAPAAAQAQEPLAWLANAESCVTPSESAGLGLPQPHPLACTASYTCPDGNVITCNGATSCLQNWNPACRLQCDGVCKKCPNYCQVQLNCPGSFKICVSETGNCVQGPGFIQCNGGRQITCDDGPIGPPGQ